MDEPDFDRMAGELAEDVHRYVKAYVKQAARHGADIASAEGGYRLPRQVICAALERARGEFSARNDRAEFDAGVENIVATTPEPSY